MITLIKWTVVLFLALALPSTFGKGADVAERKYVDAMKAVTDEMFKVGKELKKTTDPKRIAELRAQIAKLDTKEKRLLAEFREEKSKAVHADPDVELRWRQVEERIEAETFGGRIETINSQPWPARIMITEVCFWPKKGKPEWVEITNMSDQAVEMHWLRLMDGQSVDVPFPKDLQLQKNQRLMVIFDGRGGAIEVDEGASLVKYHTPAGMKDLLGDSSGQLALKGLGFWDIESFVAWGTSPVCLGAVAARDGRWTTKMSHRIANSDDIAVREMQPGCSVGWVGELTSVDDRDVGPDGWGVFLPKETSPGALTKRRPPISAGTEKKIDGKTWIVSEGYRDGDVRLDLLEVEDPSAVPVYRVYEDAECKKLLAESKQKDFQVKTKKRVCYWTAHYVYKDGSRSAESPTYAILFPEED